MANASANGKSILEEGVTPSEVVRPELAAADDAPDDDDASTGAQTATPADPRPLSPEDAVFRKALELLKTPAKKAA